MRSTADKGKDHSTTPRRQRGKTGLGGQPSRVIAIIGAGPRGIGVLERIAQNLRVSSSLAPGGEQGHSRLIVHLIDPYPPGAGRIWRRDQSPLLKLNSMAADVTVYTDRASIIEGPIAEGPSLSEWAELVRSGQLRDSLTEGTDVWPELCSLTGSSFPTRRLNSYYLEWFYRRVVTSLQGLAEVIWHPVCATGVEERTESSWRRQEEPAGSRVRLANNTHIDADTVIYALGHNGRDLDTEQQERACFAGQYNLLYIPPDFTADADLGGIRPGENVIVRGFGLAAIDLIVLLGEGRGGRFYRDAGGVLRYAPSGREPRLFVGSRRGVPYRSKISSTLRGETPRPRFFTRDTIADLVRRAQPVDFFSEVWPLITRDLLWGYYRELFVGHPERVRGEWDSFWSELIAALDSLPDPLAHSSAVGEVLERYVPHREDRCDLFSLNNPLSDMAASSREDLQIRLRAHIIQDFYDRTTRRGSATLGLFHAVFSAYLLVAEVPEELWTARSRAVDIPVWWQAFFSYIASGPPGHRLEEIAALSGAGILTFMGSGMWLRESVVGSGETGIQLGETGTRPGETASFIAGGSQYPGEVRARVCVDAWLPESRASRSDSPALHNLVTSGRGIELAAIDETFRGTTGRVLVRSEDLRVVNPQGSAHPHSFAVGPFTTGVYAGAFSRPGINALPFRQNDRIARAVLAQLSLLGEHKASV
ncbi:FAD/NAD(P)-binding protein [Lysinibacter sp. HNR]|uniref:FAD/NAD(P)-binding protein n=1 Tax=Lysinibacter sp. HNR TaxID=3031408 RepID=UPI002434E128|nr:FAD/NAD(P)-binding protein [Lysinibacter sp. HNR]WGD37099.1 FAD/NAD(P)-binding protein [Lysinibacter sp. HNR]